MSPDKGGSSSLEKLVTSFCSSLDEALIQAIAGDYDLSSKTGYRNAEKALAQLSEDVVFEEASGFNPSGTTGADDQPDDHSQDGSRSVSTTSASQHISQGRQTGSSSTDLSSLPADGQETVPRLSLFDNDSEDEKLDALRGLFDDLKEYDIKYALNKAKGDFQTALDDLLRIQELQSAGQLPRGVDGFFKSEDESGGGKKSKSKKKKQKTATAKSQGFDLDSTSKEVLEKNQAKDLKHQEEISFLADRFHMPFNEVSDVYYDKKCSSGATAVEVLDWYIDWGIEAQDDAGKEQATALSKEYPNVHDSYLRSLVHVTGTSSHASDEIALLLNKHFAKNPWKQRLDLNHRITPLPNEELEGHHGTVSAPGSRTWTPVRTPLGPPSRTSVIAADGISQAAQRILESDRARLEVSSHASQLSRKGHLYKQAAAVYGERGRTHADYSREMTSTMANLIVEKQSTSNSIDLHGVSVRDGTRIARDKVKIWWDNMGEYRTRRAKEQPFTVITGYGRHSASGKSQLRQAVASALVQDGWKMSIETGSFVVSGRR